MTPSKKKTSIPSGGTIRSAKKPKAILSKPKGDLSSGSTPHLLILLGTLLIGWEFIQTERFKWLAATGNVPERLWLPLLILGFFLAGLGFRKLSQAEWKGDLSRGVAYSMLVLVIGVGAYLRFLRLGQTYLAYWNDPAIFINYADYVSEYHQFKIIYPVGAVEPLYPDLMGILWFLFPSLKALVVQRLTANLINLTALWILYRLGREVSGKRLAGVILVALAAVSKPILIHNLGSQGSLTLTLAIGLCLLVQIRVFKRPNMRHFLQWGGGMALGLYTYNAIRPWFLFLSLVTLGWILWNWNQKPQNEPKKRAPKASSSRGDLAGMVLGRWPKWLPFALVFFFIFTYLLFYLDHLLSLFHDNIFSVFWGGNLAVWFLWQVLFGAFILAAYHHYRGIKGRIFAFASGVLFAGILSHPLALHNEPALRIANSSLLPKTFAGFFSLGFYHTVFSQLINSVYAMFLIMTDRADMNVVGDPVLDYHAIVLIILGLIYAVVRPTWVKTLLVLGALVGIIPYLFTVDPTSAKLLGALVPLLLLASLAVGKWIESAWAPAKSWKWGMVVVLLFLGFWAWEAKATYVRVYDKWWYDVVNDDMCVGVEADKVLPGKRVYLVPNETRRFYDAPTQALIHDTYPIYEFSDKNIIYVPSGKPRQDVVVIVSGDAKKVVDRLKKEFPKSQWEPAWQYYQKSHDETPFLYSVSIQASDIPDRAGKAFQFQEVPEKSWLKEVYRARLGMREGLIQREEVGPTLNPPPENAKEWPVSAEGDWEAPADGTYTFSGNSPEWVKVWMDGKVVFESMHQSDARPVYQRVSLKKGMHHVRYSTYLLVIPGFSDVTIENRAIGYKKILGEP